MLRQLEKGHSMFDDLDIPEFLRRSKDEAPQPRTSKRARWTRDMKFNDKPTREEDATTKKLRRELEQQKATKKAAGLKRLRENYGKKKS
jgi:hypothetical protein